MGNYTIQFKRVLSILYGTGSNIEFDQPYESLAYNGVTYGKLPTLPDYEKIGLAYYPVFNESYRKILNGKIIDEYYNREIGTETIDNFILILRKKMDQVMPYFNQLYKSTEIPYDALDSMRIHSVGSSHVENDESVNATNNTDTNTESGARVIGSNFPQTMLAGNGDYASTGNDTNSTAKVGSESEQNSSSNANTDGSTENLVTGYQGVAADLINKYRASLINIDTMILSEIEDCFMLILNSGDAYTERENPYYGWW